MLKTILLALCCASCVLTLGPHYRSSNQTDQDSDSDEIYGAVVSWRIARPGEGPRPTTLVFLDTTVQYFCPTEKPEECATAARARLTQTFGQDLNMGMLNDYLERNKDRGPLSKSIPTDLSKSWLSDVERKALFTNKKQDGWKTFYAKFPGAGGIMSFSRVGFNEKRDRALLYSEISCGWLCGTGHFHLLKKESGKWALIESYMDWIS